MADMAAFAGMRGSGSWSTDERPKNFRELILYLFPNGMLPLTALLGMLSDEATNDPEFSWWTKTIPSQRSALTEGDVYTDAGLSAKAQWDYDTTANNDFDAGETVYIKIATDATAQMKKYRVGHVVMLRDSSDPTRDTLLKVTAKGANYLTSTVLKTYKGKSTETTALDNTYDVVMIVGNVNEEGAVRPAAISYDPVKYSNYTQIFRTPLSITRTAKQTRLRTGDAYLRMKKEALELHGMEREKAFLWGVPTENTGSNGFPERTTGGLINFIRTYASDNCCDFVSEEAGNTWISAGEEWLDEKLELLFRYGRPEKLALCGSGALLGINRLAKAAGWVNLTAETRAYGIKVTRWGTPFGDLLLKTAPLFSFEATDRNSMVILDTANLVSRTIQSTIFKPDASLSQSIGTGRDGQEEEYLTEDGLEYHHPETFGYLTGVGLDG